MGEDMDNDETVIGFELPLQLIHLVPIEFEDK